MKRLRFVGLLIFLVSVTAFADGPTTQPMTLVDATDKAAVDAAMGKDVIIQGTVSAAEWSRSGAVMNIDFKGAEKSRLLAVLFQKTRATFDASFSGDVSKTLTGAKVRIKGKLVVYGGQQESFKGRPQVILDRPDQITVVEPASH